MHRLVPCLATLVILSLPACKRDRGGPADPEYGSSDYGSSPTPTPEQVCIRLSEMAAADLGGVDPEIQRETIAMCTEQMIGEQQTRGPEGWDGVARCVVAAQTEADIDRCDDLYPPAGPAEATTEPPPQGATQEDQVCVIMLSVFAMELMSDAEAAGQPPPELAEDDIREAHAECVRSLDDARQTRSGTDYDRLLDCLANADSSPGMDQCLGP